MALTIECNNVDTIDLPNFVDQVAKRLTPEDNDSLAECAPLLKALANNRQFVAHQLNQELALWKDFQTSNRYTSQTMMFGGRDNFRVRANIWTPLSSHPDVRSAEENLFFYRVPHDHNFSFLTVGYLGPGYETTIYEYDPDTVAGMCGEHVRLEFLEKTTLPEGKVMLYRAGRDIHSQEHAPAFSVSLNLLVDTPEVSARSQFFFDLESSSIRTIAPSSNTSRIMICQLARHLGDARSAELLDALTVAHPSARLRAVAYETLAMLEPAMSERFWERALSDRHPIVREAARTAIAKHQDCGYGVEHVI